MLGPVLMAAIKKQGYTAPTPIQAQAIPAVMSGMVIIMTVTPSHSIT
jgi:superfamily II DNA/RNA helicase